MSDAKSGYRFETLQVHAGQEPAPGTNARAVPIYQTTSYMFHDTDHAARLFALQEFGNIYTRIMNPTTDLRETHRGARGRRRRVGVPSGLGRLSWRSPRSASTARTSCRRATCTAALTTRSRSPSRLGIGTKFVEGDDPADFAKAIDARTRAL